MNILFKYTKKDYIQNPTHISLLLHITQSTTQHPSCCTYSIYYSAQHMSFANQFVPSYNPHKPLILQHILHNKHNISPSFVLPKINLIKYILCRCSAKIDSLMLRYPFHLKGIIAVT